MISSAALLLSVQSIQLAVRRHSRDKNTLLSSLILLTILTLCQSVSECAMLG